jgi:hypothetical protein
MATKSKNTSLVPAKSKSIQQIIKSHYNTRTTKNPFSSPQDKPLPSPNPHSLGSRKRMNFIDLVSSLKKGPGVAYESDEPPNTTPTTTPVFNLATLKKLLLEPFIKLLEKEKNKLVSVGLASELDFENKGGFVKPL